MRFFFYGTLIAGSDNPSARLSHALLREIGPAEAVGTLHAIPDPAGWYPALLAGDGRVHGILYQARDDFGADSLARLDAYEDFDPADPAGSLYLRKEVEVSGSAAQAYLFNRPLPADSRPIPGGDFREWLRAEGLEPYREP